MGAARRGEVVLEGTAGRYVLRFSMDAIDRIQDALQQPIGAVLGSVLDRRRLDMSALRTVVRLAVRQPARVTDEQIGDLIDDVGLKAIREALLSVFGKEDPPAWATDLRKMRVDAASLGIRSDRFFALTLDDIAVDRQGALEWWERFHDVMVTAAWCGEYFARQKTLTHEHLKKFLHATKQEQPVKQNWQEMKAAMKALTASQPGTQKAVKRKRGA